MSKPVSPKQEVSPSITVHLLEKHHTYINVNIYFDRETQTKTHVCTNVPTPIHIHKANFMAAFYG